MPNQYRVAPEQVRTLLEQKNDKGQPVFTHDQVLSHLGEVDPVLGQKLQSALKRGIGTGQILNHFAYGKSAGVIPPKPPKEFGEGLLYPEKPKGMIATAWDYATAPIDAAVGVAQKTIGGVAGAFGAQKVQHAANNTPEAIGLKDNLRQTADIAPVALGTIGSIAAGPLGAGAGTGIGVAAQHGIRQAIGDESTDLQDIPAQMADTAAKTAGAVVLDAGFNKAGALVAASPPVQGAKNLLSKSAKRMIESLIKPGLKETKFGKDPAGAIVKEGIVASNLDDLLTKVTAKAKEAGEEIDRLVTEASGPSPPQINQSPLIEEPFSRAIKEASKMKRTNAPLVSALENLRDDLLETAGKTEVPLGVLGTKREVQSMIKWNAADPFANEKNRVLWEVFDNLRGAVNKSVKGVDDANARYADLAAAKVSIERRVARVGSSNILSNMSPLVTGAAAGGGEYVRTGDTGQALKAGIGTAIGTKMMGTAAAKTIGAKALNSIPGAVSSILSKLAPAEKAVMLKYLTDSSFAPDEQ